jgi:hypothetical protein
MSGNSQRVKGEVDQCHVPGAETRNRNRAIIELGASKMVKKAFKVSRFLLAVFPPTQVDITEPYACLLDATCLLNTESKLSARRHGVSVR